MHDERENVNQFPMGWVEESRTANTMNLWCLS